MFKLKYLVLSALVLLISAGCNQVANSSAKTPNSINTNDNINSGKTYSKTEIASHNSQSSCWTIIEGNVYDITKYIPRHPGGPARILQICGKDGSSAFDNQHGTQMRPQMMLSNFKIGTLAK